MAQNIESDSGSGKPNFKTMTARLQNQEESQQAV